MGLFCEECGKQMEPDWVGCPICGEGLQNVAKKPILKNPIVQKQQVIDAAQKLKSFPSWILDNVHVFTFIGFIFTAIGLLCPAAYFSRSLLGTLIESDFIWMSGTHWYYHISIGAINMSFLEYDITLYILSLVCVGLLALNCFIMGGIFQMIRKKRLYKDKIPTLFCAIFNIIIIIAWNIIMQVHYSQYLTSNNYNGTYLGGFGQIGPIIGSIFMLFGLCLKYREDIKQFIHMKLENRKSKL